MCDEKHIEAVARLWVDAGEDAESFFWSVSRLKLAIQKETARRSEAERATEQPST